MLNQSYRIIWNAVRGCMVVVSEAAKSHGKSSSAVKKIALVALTGAMMSAVTANAVVGVPIDGAYSAVVGNDIPNNTHITVNTSPVNPAVDEATGVVVTNPVLEYTTNNSILDVTAAPSTGDALAGGLYAESVSLGGTLTNNGNITTSATSTTGEAQAYGVWVDGVVAGALNNTGIISATATGIDAAQAYGINVSANVTGSLVSSGAIDAVATATDASAYGINVSGNAASLSNIAGGTIHATATGVDEASAYGINVAGNATTLGNAATITATAMASAGDANAYGINVSGNVDTLTNTATIAAIATGDISNPANEAGAYGINVASAGSIENSGGIIAIAYGVDEAKAYGINVSGAVAGAVGNSGVILAGAMATVGDASAYGINVSGAVTGAVSNTGAFIVAGALATNGDASAYGIQVGSAGTIVNGGDILAVGLAQGEASAYGINVSDNVGALTNTASIAVIAAGDILITTPANEASAYGINLGSAGSITNSGQIMTAASGINEAAAYGINVTGNVDSLINTASISASAGDISTPANEANAYAVSVGSAGGITNSATLTATANGAEEASANGIYVLGNVDTLTNSLGGVINSIANASAGDANAYGIHVGSAGAITNNDLIAAEANAVSVGEASAYGINVAGDIATTLSNNIGGGINATASGINEANAYGINVSGAVTTSLSNAATISATANATAGEANAYAISVGSAGAITNNGSLDARANGFDEAAAYGINVTSNVGVLTNAASITVVAGDIFTPPNVANSYGVKVGGDVAGIANSAAINATAFGIEEANAYGIEVAGLVAAGIVNSSNIYAGAGSVDAEAYGVKVGSVNGNVLNSGELSGAAEGVDEAKAYGLMVSDTLTGDLINTSTGKITAQAKATTGLAEAYGVKIDTLAGSIDNSHLIKGEAVSTSGNYIGYSIAVENTPESLTPATYTITNNVAGTLDGALNIESAYINVFNNGLLNTHEYQSYVAGNYTQSSTGLLNIDVRSMAIGGIGNPLTANTVSATLGANYGGGPTSYNADGGKGGLGLYYGGLNVGGVADFAATGNPVQGSFRVTGYFDTLEPTAIKTQATEAELVKLAQSDTSYLYHVVNAGTLVTPSDINKLVITDNMMSVQFTPELDGNSINFRVTETGMTSIGSSVLNNDLSSATGAASLLDPLLKGPWLNQQNNLAYGNGGGSTDGQQNNFSLVQQYLYYVGNSANNSSVGNKLQEALPLITGGVSNVTQGGMHNLNNMIQSRQEGQMGISTGDLFYGDKSVWFKPFGSWTSQDKKDGANGFNADTYGMAFGLDGELSEDNRLGFALTYARSNITGKIADPTAKVDSYLASVYGSHSLNENTEINYQLAAGWNSVNGNRPILDHTYAAKSSYDSKNVSAAVGVMHTIDLNETTKFIASGRANYTWTRDDSYRETGAYDMNLSTASNKREELLLLVDGKITHPLSDSVLFAANLGLGYDLFGDRASINSTFIGDIPGFSNINFVTDGAKVSRFLGRGGLGVTGNLNENLELTGRYDLEIRDGYDNQTASMKLRWKFN